MKAVELAYFGGPEALELRVLPDPVAGPGQVVVAVEAAGVGLVDARMRGGLYPSVKDAGFVLGGEIAGEVIAVGDGVDAAWLGQRVYALSRSGGYAEQCAVDAAILARIPAGLAAADAVALGANALVADYCLRKGDCQPGAKVLVRGASGGIGLATVQAALQKGARVTAITSRADWARRISDMGAEAILREAADGLPEDFDVVIDPVGGADVGRFVSRLRAEGRYVICGAAGGRPEPDFGMSLFQWASRSLSIAFQSLDSVPLADLNAAAEAIFETAARGELSSLIDQTYPLEDARLAHQRLDEGSVFGRLVLTTGRSFPL